MPMFKRIEKLVHADIPEGKVTPSPIPKAGMFVGRSYYWPGGAVVLLETYLDEGEVIINTTDPVPEGSFLEYYIDNLGLDWTLGLEPSNLGGACDQGILNFLLTEGLAPGQQFWVEMQVWSSKHWTDCGWEHDGGVDWEILSAIPLRESHLAAWELSLKLRKEDR